MKKKVLSALLSVAMVATLLVGCGAKAEAPAAEAPAATEEVEEEAPAAEEPAAEETAEETAEEPAADGELISVGIINNDPNESGYRTANDADLKQTFCDATGYK